MGRAASPAPLPLLGEDNMEIDRLQGVENLENREFIFCCLDYLKDRLHINQILATLTDAEQCGKLFFCRPGKAILLEVTNMDESEIRQARYDGGSQVRYYNDLFRINDRAFLVTNYWYKSVSEVKSNRKVKDNRTPFLQWVKAQK